MKEDLYICYRKDEDGNVTIDGYAYGEEWVSQALLMDDWKYPTEEEAREAHAKLLHDGVIQNKRRGRPISREEDRYIKKNKSGTYRIQKSVHGVIGHYGTFRTIEDAREERDYLESIGWDYDNMD